MTPHINQILTLIDGTLAMVYRVKLHSSWFTINEDELVNSVWHCSVVTASGEKREVNL